MGLLVVGVLGWGIAALFGWKALGYQAVGDRYSAYYLWALVAGPALAAGALVLFLDPLSALAYGPIVFYALPFIATARILGELPIPFLVATLGAFLAFDLWIVALVWGYRKVGDWDREAAVSRIALP
jgi:hypothetical protein